MKLPRILDDDGAFGCFVLILCAWPLWLGLIIAWIVWVSVR